MDSVQNDFDELWQALSSPKEMLLGSTNEPGSRVTTIYMRVPENLVRKFPGFAEIAENQLPKTATCLIERDGEFWKVFDRVKLP
jgi:hypothetical protein